MDFVTDLPTSDGYTYILVAVDWFSKACRLIPLKGLPTALEAAEGLFQHLFRNFGIPEDIVSDRGPQIVSRVWKAFFHRLDVTVSLTSGYHLQSNGQTECKIQEAIWHHTRAADTRMTEASKYQPGQEVLLSTIDIWLCLPCKKLSP